MVPLETLDQYMVTCIAACGVYLLFMLFLLVCFLRKFNNNPEPIKHLASHHPIELFELHTVSNPYRYTVVNQDPSNQVIPAHNTRSNRSYSSSRNSSHVHRIQFKKIPFGGVDMSQMERLATL